MYSMSKLKEFKLTFMKKKPKEIEIWENTKLKIMKNHIRHDREITFENFPVSYLRVSTACQKNNTNNDRLYGSSGAR